MAYLPAGISLEELLSAAEQLQTALPTPMTSRPGQLATCCLALPRVRHVCHGIGTRCQVTTFSGSCL